MLIKRFNENLETIDTNDIIIDDYLDIEDIDYDIENLDYNLIKRYNANPYEIFRRLLVPHKIIRRILLDLGVDVQEPNQKNNIVKVRKYIYKTLNIESKIKDRILNVVDYNKYLEDREFWDNATFVKDEFEWVSDGEELGLL